METLQLIGSTLGLSFVSGIRLYTTLFVLGLSIRFQLFHLSPAMSHLGVLADTKVLIASGIAFLLEFFADKVPWVDTAWDTVHTVIRPIGAVLLGAAALGHIDPVLKLVVLILCGGLAFTSHSTKAATRVAVNHSPEPFSNIGLSLAEDAILVPAGIWLAVHHAVIVLVLIAVFLAGFAWIAPKIFRLLRAELNAIGAFFGRRTKSA